MSSQTKKVTDNSKKDLQSSLMDNKENSSPPVLVSQTLDDIRVEEMKMVRGIFRNIEFPGEAEFVHFRKYKGPQGEFRQVLEDGKEYTVPLFVARYINGVEALSPEGDRKNHYCSYQQFADPSKAVVLDSRGNPMPQANTIVWKRRISFEALGFGDV